MEVSPTKYLPDAREGTRPPTVDCANSTQFSVGGAVVLEVPSQDTSVIKPIDIRLSTKNPL
jgi:hypothetical protein